MKEHLQVQDLQVNELDAELTPLELEELDALKGGALGSNYSLNLFPRGIPSIFIYESTLPVVQLPAVQIDPVGH
jgi:hypothetical protein